MQIRLSVGSALKISIQADAGFLTLLLLCGLLGPRTVPLGQKVEMSLLLPLILCALMKVGTAGAIEGFREVAEREVVAIPRTLTDIRSL